ncbi:MAG: hypothetical protein ABI220_04005 [Candidatus Saccharimonadales bacterium]
MQTWIKQIRGVLIYGLSLALLIVLGSVPAVQAASCVSNPSQQSCSPSYGVSETFFGSGGQLDDSCSGAYCAKQSAGELTVGNTAGGSFQARAGFNTNREPSLTFIVDNASQNIGVLDVGSTAKATATFHVQSYLASGYVVKVSGGAPTNAGHQLMPMAAAAASQAGTEQFGMNLVKNQTTCPTPAPFNFGADPSQAPDNTFSFGAAATGYDTCGKFKFVNNDIVASSATSSGETDYTISYIFNITNVTPGGTYSLNQVLVATSTF